jgi:hypothetical protein
MHVIAGQAQTISDGAQIKEASQGTVLKLYTSLDRSATATKKDEV